MLVQGMRLTAGATVGWACLATLALGTHGGVACAALSAQDALGAALHLPSGAACRARGVSARRGSQVDWVPAGSSNSLGYHMFEGKCLRSDKPTGLGLSRRMVSVQVGDKQMHPVAAVCQRHCPVHRKYRRRRGRSAGRCTSRQRWRLSGSTGMQ